MVEKLEEKIRCFLCRKQICGVKQDYQLIESEALEIWNEKCWDSLTEVLFASKDHSLKYILCNGGYCLNCWKRIWDLDFSFKTIQKLQKQLESLKQGIIKDIRVNYETIFADKNETKADVLSDKEGDLINISLSDLWGKCSYDEAVQMVFKALDSTTCRSSEVSIGSRTHADAISLSNKRKRKRPIRHPVIVPAVPTPCSSLDVVTEALSNVTVKLEIPDEVEEDNDKNDNDSHDEDFAVNNNQWVPSNGEEDSWDSNLSLEEEDDDLDEDYSASESKSKKRAPRITRRLTINKPKASKTRQISRSRKGGKKSTEDSEASWKKNFICTEESCPRRFKDDLGLQIHVRKDHLALPNPYHCTLCEKDFSGVSNLKSHLRRHEGTFRFPCPVCQKGYHTKINLGLHIESRHSTKSPDQVCQICSKRFKTSEELEAHSTAVHQGPNPFTCEDCKVLFTNSGDLKCHVQQNHQKPDGPFCTICGKTFATTSYLKAHQRLIHPKAGTLLTCRTCGEKFEKITLLTAHRETHLDGETKACQCDQCGRSFKGKKGLAYHILTHTGEKPYNCKICGKGFRQSAHCKKHEEIHSGLQNYVCHICGKACTNKGNLRLHMKIHDKETGIPKIRKPSAPKKPKNLEANASTVGSSTCSASEDAVGAAGRMFQQGALGTGPVPQFRFSNPSDYYSSAGAQIGLHYQYQPSSQFPANFGGFKM